MPKLSKEEYTVGWICALADPELRISRQLLDGSEHDPPDLASVDPHPYTYGTMNGHNIVMACLPAGTIGTSAAAATAEGMRSAFPSLRFTLLVGIGGGVPSASHDIRLGDVVVGHPNAVSRHAGVIRYDFGKAMHDGSFQQTGTLNNPPHRLLEALSHIKSARPGHGKFLDYLKDLEEIAPAPRVDKLFRADCSHVPEELTCRKCSSDDEIWRPPRDPSRPHIHYGTIASGDEVMKDGLKRDALRNAQPDILSFEMEAGGLMNILQCLVVRGICDYCDSHKNKIWQPYAAAVAAAFAKEVLRIAPARVFNVAPESSRQCGQNLGPQTVSMLPYDPDDDFVGRETLLERIESTFESNKGKMLSRVALWGLGGVGKSQIAIHYGWRVSQSERETSVYWVHASSQERFYNDFLSIASRLGLPGHDDPKVDHAKITCDWLSSGRSGKWLLILDNADNSDFTRAPAAAEPQISHFTIPQYLPQKQGCAVLITSRDRRAALDLIRDYRFLIEVTEMSQEEAVKLFQRKTSTDHHNPVRMSRLAEQLDRIPLAITQAAAYIMQDVRMDIPRYLERLQDIGRAHALLTTGLNDTRRDVNVHNAVVKTWEISFSRIKEQDEQAAHLLYTIAFFDKHDIPELLLLQLPGAGEEAVNAAIDTLLRFCFLRRTVRPIDGQNAYETHRLVQLATKVWTHVNWNMERFAIKALRMVNFPYGDRGFDDWQICQILEPHADSVTKALTQCWTSRTRGSRSADSAHFEANSTINFVPWFLVLVRSKMLRGQLSYKRAIYAYQQGKFSKALELGRLAKCDLQQVHGKNDTRTLACGALISRACLATEDQKAMSEAVSVGEDTVERQTKVLGGGHVDTLTTRAHLAMVYKWQGKLVESISILTEVVEMLTEMSRNELARADAYQSLAMAMNDLSILLGDRGEWTKAETLQTTALQHLQLFRDDSHPETLNMKANLAWSKLKLDRLHEATTMLEEVVRIKQQVLVPDHFETMSSMSRLAKAYELQGKPQDAYRLLNTVLERSKFILGEDHPTTIRRMVAVAKVQHTLGDPQEALNTAEQCANLSLRRQGSQHPNYIWAIGMCRQCRKEIRLMTFNRRGFLDIISRFAA